MLLHVDVVNDSNRVVEKISEHINHMAVNETQNIPFAMSYKVPDYTGVYTLKAYVEAFEGDSIRSNDTIVKEFRCYRDSVGICTVEQSSWQLGQNLPNPATGMTQVPVTLPEPGRVLLQVHSVEGRLLYRGEYAVAEGKSLLSLDLAGYAAGVYYYSVEYRGERKVRKMVVE